MSRASVGIWLTVGSGLAFASSGPLAKSVMVAGWSPGAVLVVRLTGAAVIMLGLAAVADPGGLRGCAAHLRTIGAFGVVAVAGVQASFFLSLQYLQVGVTLMIQFLAPVAVIGWNWVVRGHRPHAVTLLGAGIALAGSALVIDVFSADGLSLAGLGWAGLSMLCNAAFFLLSARTSDSLSPVVLLGTGLTVAAASMWTLTALGVLPVMLGGREATLAEHSIPVAVSLALLVAISTVVAYLCGVAGAARIGATLMSLILLSEVLFAVALSWLLLAERVRPVQLVGGVLVIGGIAVARRAAERRAPSTKPLRDALT
ncbi:DMT family transporter [Nocardia cyriacigeorgica]|nr:DMT family transporter [Nocardia cyriacigeorgica]NEW52718.1 DMT family transporter [Nocardia cyriacigeorgica]